MSEQGWQPIETGPKDGTIVLGWRAPWERPCTIHYDRGHWRDYDSYPIVGDGPTHWMPLPDPPVSEGSR